MCIGINSTEFLKDDAETEPFVSEANAAMEALMPEGKRFEAIGTLRERPRKRAAAVPKPQSVRRRRAFL